MADRSATSDPFEPLPRIRSRKERNRDRLDVSCSQVLGRQLQSGDISAHARSRIQVRRGGDDPYVVYEIRKNDFRGE